MTELDARYMARALELARLGLYSTGTNPRVGCVIVKDGEIVGEGWHRFPGEAHAEIHALNMAGEQAKGATVYVTLEPCCHFGRTPPCSQALIAAQVGHVVSAMQDPNPLVGGKGLNQLQEAGIGITVGMLETESRALNPGFIKRMSQQRPYVRVKLAMSLDGRTAMASGESVWITGTEARKDVHRLRARSNAVITGMGTFLHDDPSLNVRLERDEMPGLADDLPMPTPARVILDPKGQLPADAGMLQTDGPIWLVTSEDVDSIEHEKLEQIQLATTAGHFNLDEVLTTLADKDCNEVLVEAGAGLAGAFVQAGLVDELIVYMAPHLMGDEGKGLLHLPGLEHMKDRVNLVIDDIRAVGNDWRISARIG